MWWRAGIAWTRTPNGTGRPWTSPGRFGPLPGAAARSTPPKQTRPGTPAPAAIIAPSTARRPDHDLPRTPGSEGRTVADLGSEAGSDILRDAGRHPCQSG